MVMSKPEGKVNKVLTKRKVYSKGGCRECKRRKIKCAEQKPACWQCQRLNKVCSYPDLGEKVPRVSKKLYSRIKSVSPSEPPKEENYNVAKGDTYREDHRNQKTKPTFTSSSTNDGFLTSALPSPGALVPETPDSSPHSALNQSFSRRNNMSESKDPMPSVVKLINDPKSDLITDSRSNDPHMIYGDQTTLIGSSSSHEYSPSNVLTSGGTGDLMNQHLLFMRDDFDFYKKNDLEVLASDLNNLVNDIMYEFSYEKPSDNFSGSGQGFECSFGLHGTDQDNVAFKFNETDVVLKNIPLDYINLKNDRDKIYLTEFFHSFAGYILPFRAYDEGLGEYYNPARDILIQCASYEPFLLAAILSQGAKVAHHKSNNIADERAYISYLSKCLELLGPAINIDFSKSERARLFSNIEGILLTLLLLTAANASSSKHNWRPHLGGAKDILLRNASTNLRSSKILVFCKLWFIVLEVLAGLSSKIGGTLQRDEDIDSLTNLNSDYELAVLRELGFSTDQGFNILCGYHNTCIGPLTELIKLLNKFRNRKLGETKVDPFSYLKVLKDFTIQSRIMFVTNKFELDRSDFSNGVLPKGSLMDEILLKNGDVAIRSWMDCSHMSYVIASIITIYTTFMQVPSSSPHIQRLADIIISMIRYVKNVREPPEQIFKFSIMMIQWPVSTAALNVQKQEDRDICMKYFEIASKLGSASAEMEINRIRRAWARNDNGALEYHDDNIDTVSY